MIDRAARKAITLLTKYVVQLEKEIKMDFTQFNAGLDQLGTDVSAEIAAAVAEIDSLKATSTSSADQAVLDAATARLVSVDAIVKAGIATFTVSTSTDPVVSTSTGS